MSNFIRKLAGVLIFIGVIVASFVVTGGSTAESFSLYELTENDKRFTLWDEALQSAQLTGMLKSGYGFTVLAPTDAAIKAMDQQLWQMMLKDRELMRQFVFYHIVNGQLTVTNISLLNSIPTTLGSPISVNKRNGQFYLNGLTKITIPNVQAANGILHGVDRVLSPSEIAIVPTVQPTSPASVKKASIFEQMAQDGRFTVFTGHIRTVGMENLLDTKGPFTLFVPTDAAFAQLPVELRQRMSTNHAMMRQMLLYHMMPGQQMITQLRTSPAPLGTLLDKDATISFRPQQSSANNGGATGLILNDAARVIDGDYVASNGVLHVVDAVLIPPVKDFDGPQSAPGTANQLYSTFDVLINDARFGRFVEDVQLAGLESMLAWHGPFTVFAPTDAAYATLPSKTIERMEENYRNFQHFAMYHIVKGHIDLTTLQNSGQLATMLGENLTLTHANGVTTIDGRARVILQEIQTSNGIIYAVDAVLIPSNLR
ncbi:MAG: fasciclin domain-containing protein [Candidatus Promineifilaceae bacterium]